MPRSFLVRLRPSLESFPHHDAKSDKYRSNGKKQSHTSAQPYDATPSNQTTASAEMTVANSTQGKHLQSQPGIMESSHYSQSNPTIVMTSYQTNQSAISIARAHSHEGPRIERTILEPKYHVMPYIPVWTQYDYFPSNNNTWCYPSLNNMQLQKYPATGDGHLHTGEVSYPVYSKDNAMYTTQQHSQKFQGHESEQQELRDVSIFPTSFKEFFSVEEKPGTQHPNKDHMTKSATALESIPKDQIRSDHCIQKPIALATEKAEQEDVRPSQTHEPSLSCQTSKSTSNPCETVLPNPNKLDTGRGKIHTCSQCKKIFNRASNLRAHMKTHSEHKPYKCDFCGKGFHQKIDKRIHHYTHTGEKPHQCTKCGRGFKQLTHLNYHMRTHSDTHMYHCSYCGKGFNQKGNLQAHIYGHTGQRPFKCEICSKGFTLRSTLNTHLRTHAPKKPFVCEYCNKAFYQKNALKMHHIASHPIVNGKSIL